MSSQSTPKITTSDLTVQLAKLGLHTLADGCDDFIAKPIK